LLAAWRPERVLTSPDRRCLETVQPCAAELGAEARPDDRLSEAGYRGDPALVRTLVSQLLDRREAVAVCTPRTVLGTLLGALAGNASAGVGCGIPRFDPFLRPGESRGGHVSARSARVVATERHGTTESASDAPA
jgi:8-oxo-dGTP diphosphatase